MRLISRLTMPLILALMAVWMSIPAFAEIPDGGCPEGTIEATILSSDGRDCEPALLRPGEFFGEDRLLDNAPCPATYRAAGEHTIVLRLTKRSLDALVADDVRAPDIIDAIRRHGRDGKIRALASRAPRHYS